MYVSERTQRRRGCPKKQSLKRWRCCTVVVVVVPLLLIVTMDARLLLKSRGSKCGFVCIALAPYQHPSLWRLMFLQET